MFRTFLLFVLVCVGNVFGVSYEPKAKPYSTVISGNARFTVLTPRVIRLEWSESGEFTDSASLTMVNRKLPKVDYETKEENGSLFIKTEFINLKYKLNSGKFNEANLSIEYSDGSDDVLWQPGLENTQNLLGTTRTLDSHDGDLYKRGKKRAKLKLEQGLLSRDGWTLIDDSKRPLFDDSDWAWVKARDFSQIDWYFFGYGKNYKQALSDFTQIAGRIPMPPRFAFGYWWSKYWAYSDQEMRQLVSEFEDHNIPLDVLVVDMDWHVTEKSDWYVNGKKTYKGNTWTGFTWDDGYFPDYKYFLEWTDDKKLKTALNLHPAAGIQSHESVYKDFAKAMGVDPSTKQTIDFDIVDKNYAQTYFDLVIHPYERAGVDFWWLDWQQWSKTKIEGVNPTFYLNYVHYTDMQRQRNKRPILYHRWGGLGNHRYQIGFSGDTHISWDSLAFQPYFTSTASNVCYGYWSHDIGGHYYGDKDNAELYTRWLQWGAFSPIMRTHATKDSEVERRIWAYPLEYYYPMRDAILLRYSLIPYIYNAAREAYDTGVSIVRPMYYDYSDKDEAYQYKQQFMFGDSILVSPVVKAIAQDKLYAMQEVWLPEGRWVEMQTGAILDGDRVVSRPYMLSEIPVFVKYGSIIPMQPSNRKASEGIGEQLVLTLYGKGNMQTEVYEDNGDSDRYIDDRFATTSVSAVYDKNLKLEISPVKGKYDGMVSKRQYEIRIPASVPPLSVKINGKKVRYSRELSDNSWSYDGNELCTLIRTSECSVKRKTLIEAKFGDYDAELVNGRPGMFKRLMYINKLIQRERHGRKRWDIRAASYTLSDLAGLSQTGYRVEIGCKNRQAVLKELSEFEDECALFRNAVERNMEKNGTYKSICDFVEVIQ